MSTSLPSFRQRLFKRVKADAAGMVARMDMGINAKSLAARQTRQMDDCCRLSRRAPCPFLPGRHPVCECCNRWHG